MIRPHGELTPRTAAINSAAHPTFRPAFPRFHTPGHEYVRPLSHHRKLPKQVKPALFSVGNESGNREDASYYLYLSIAGTGNGICMLDLFNHFGAILKA